MHANHRPNSDLAARKVPTTFPTLFRRDTLASIPGASIVVLIVLQLVTIAPCVAPGALQVPQLIASGRALSVVYLLAAALAVSLIVLGAIRAAQWIGRGSGRVLMPLVSGLVTLLYVSLLGASAFYAKFGVYPRPAIALDFVAAPSAFVAYSKSGASSTDVVVFASAVALVVAASTLVTRLVWLEPRSARRAAWSVLLGSVLLLGLRAFPLTRSRQHRFFVMEHSLPAAKYAFQAAGLLDFNRVEVAQPYVPRPPGGQPVAPVPRARHVLLIIAECLRADHLPAYGYSRNTTPFIQSEETKWVAFKRAYAHGSRTGDSFPVMFNSRYFAAIDRDNEGATAAWRFLRGIGAGTAFLSAGAMEWGGIMHSLNVGALDHELVASDVDPANRKAIITARSDYAVDDGVPLDRYVNLLETSFRGRSSFTAVHFVGSHYPFQYSDVAETFLPTLRHPSAVAPGIHDPRVRLQSYDQQGTLARSTITEFVNAFDSSIVHIDGLVQAAVAALTRLGIADDSVVIITSDHGESLGEHQTFLHGTTLYDEQVRVPLLMRIGANLAPVRSLVEARLAHVVGQVDLMPTVLHLLSGTSPPIKEFDGASLLGGSAKQYEMLMFRGIGEKLAFVTDDAKYIFDVPGQLAEQYALTSDPGEQTNRWSGDEHNVSQFIDTLVKKGVVRHLR